MSVFPILFYLLWCMCVGQERDPQESRLLFHHVGPGEELRWSAWQQAGSSAEAPHAKVCSFFTISVPGPIPPHH